MSCPPTEPPAPHLTGAVPTLRAERTCRVVLGLSGAGTGLVWLGYAAGAYGARAPGDAAFAAAFATHVGMYLALRLCAAGAYISRAGAAAGTPR